MIIWLASYPKSGNTWLRSLLASYYFSNDGDFNFNLLQKIDQFPSYNHFKDYNKIFSNPTDTTEFWIEEQTKINSDNKIKLFKTHNALCKINGNSFTDNNNTLGAVYVVRDPRNVITSLANHYEINLDQAFEFMVTEQKAIIQKKEDSYVGFVALFSWIFHQTSWANNKLFPTLVIRYEDLQNETFLTLKKVINFIDNFDNSKSSFNKSYPEKPRSNDPSPNLSTISLACRYNILILGKFLIDPNRSLSPLSDIKFKLFFLNILRISFLSLPLLGMPIFIISNLNLKQLLLQEFVFLLLDLRLIYRIFLH